MSTKKPKKQARPAPQSQERTEVSAHHPLPDSIRQPLTPQQAADRIKPLAEEAVRLLKLAEKKEQDGHLAALACGAAQVVLRAECEALKIVDFGAVRREYGLDGPTPRRHLRAAEGLALATRREPGVDHTGRPLGDLVYYSLALHWPAKGQRYSCETTQLRDPDAAPQWLDLECHVGARWSLPEHTETLLELAGDTVPRKVWDPFSGSGVQSEVLRKSGREVVSTDIVRYGYGPAKPWDARCAKKPDWLGPDWGIVGNPPWMCVDGVGPRQHLQQFCGFRPKLIALFLPSSMTGCLLAPRFYEGYRLDRVIIFSKAKSRSFNPMTKREYAESWESCHMVWVPGKPGRTQLTYVE